MRNIAMMMSLLLVFLLAGCQTKNTQTTPPPTQSQDQGEPQPEPDVDETEQPEDPGSVPPPIVADASLYRGTIQEITHQEDGTATLVLQQVEGTDFGAAELSVVLDEDTSAFMESDMLQQGDYLEVYYGGEATGGQPVKAITANLLPDAALCIYNGELVEQLDSAEPGVEYSLLLQGQGEEDQILFHVASDTQVYLDIQELQQGDRLNVYFNGITTRSIPPQATASEIRHFQ